MENTASKADYGKKIIVKISTKDFFISLLCFVMSQIQFMLYMSPFGMAFYGAIFLFMAAVVFLWGKCSSKDVLTAGMTTLFITSAILSLAMLRLKYDMYMLLLPFIIAWLSDTGAYFTGYFLGKHKLAPKMSPKKTVEGAIGGVIFAGLAAFIYLGCVKGNFSAGYAWSAILFGGVGSVISQIGDLAASCIKRDFEKKDYGSLLPGHGGLMDRFDSVLFTAPYVLCMIIYFGL
jgi:phosphatidate cytidylyltransferase